MFDECSSLNSSRVYLIKPDGFPEPFETYCDTEAPAGGWTVIYRRVDGSVKFDRDWEAYKNGFGFLSSEFWLGNNKLSYLTNQKVYELRIDLTLSNGTALFAIFSAFRISDEWSEYQIVSVGTYIGNIDLACPRNMIFGNCSCQPSCDDPTGLTNCDENCAREETCVCSSGYLKSGDNCVSPNECRCYVEEANRVLSEGEMYVNTGCSVRCICKDGALSCNTSYRCSPNAECREQDGLRKCYCNDGYEGDGETCTPLYADCFEAYQAGETNNGVYTILPAGWPSPPFEVYCDMTTSGGGWTVFQRRVDGTTNFMRNWTSYRNGFGSLDQSTDFWLGNEQLYYLTKQKGYRLRVDIVTSGGASKYEEYSSFRIDSESTKYRLVDIGSASGTAANGMEYTNGRSFSTYDQDNDEVCPNYHCAQKHKGGWWYGVSVWCPNCYSNYCNNFQQGGCYTSCTYSNLNGVHNGGNADNIYWRHRNNCHLSFSEMKIRPSS